MAVAGMEPHQQVFGSIVADMFKPMSTYTDTKACSYAQSCRLSFAAIQQPNDPHQLTAQLLLTAAKSTNVMQAFWLTFNLQLVLPTRPTCNVCVPSARSYCCRRIASVGLSVLAKCAGMSLW